MLMRYHYGLSVGHVYAHPSLSAHLSSSTSDSSNESHTETLNCDEGQGSIHSAVDTLEAELQDGASDNDVELLGEGIEEEDIDDEELLVMHEMYGH
jgi:hypothetical protein